MLVVHSCCWVPRRGNDQATGPPSRPTPTAGREPPRRQACHEHRPEVRCVHRTVESGGQTTRWPAGRELNPPHSPRQGRDAAKRNVQPPGPPRTRQAETWRVTAGWLAFALAARGRLELRFTSLLHHVTEEMPREAYFDPKKTVAVGPAGQHASTSAFSRRGHQGLVEGVPDEGLHVIARPVGTEASGSATEATTATCFARLNSSQGMFGFKTVARLSESCFPGGHDSESRATVEYSANCLKFADRR